ncbi:MAG: cupin domain-containing protein [Deltaproteobacteria bacterium]|nr:cupin domain-containing protein [Deltaproteobacteria bacterium]
MANEFATELAPWQQALESPYSDQLKRFVYQNQEEALAASLPHVLIPIPAKGTVMGHSSPHQTGDLRCCDILFRGPMYDLTSHQSSIPPKAPVRGAHRHISAPTLFCISGKGWEFNDGTTYTFELYDLLVVPPYTVHQHGGDRDIGCQIHVPQTRMIDALGVLHREQIKFGEKPTFPQGTEPLKDDAGKLIGYKIKKGVLGITEDLDVYLGPTPNIEAVFNSRRHQPPWQEEVENTYDRYLKLLHDEVEFCNETTHVIRYEEQPWEWTRQGRLKWLVHPGIACSARRVWIYMQEISPGGRSGKHRHVAEEQVFVINGRGYDIHDGERWNWQKGDIISVPAMTEHQHFNADTESPALIFGALPSMCTDLGLGGIEQIEDAPDYLENMEKGR